MAYPARMLLAPVFFGSAMADALRIVGITELRADLQRFQTELPIAYAKALTFTAQAAQAEIKTEMRSVFDRPTSYALNSLVIKAATVGDQQAAVRFKADSSSGEVPATRFMGPEVSGGMRGHKRAEIALQSRGIISSSMSLVPAIGAPTDSYGNISGNTITQMLNSLVRGGKSRSEWFVIYDRNGSPTEIARKVGRRMQMMFRIINRTPFYRVRLHFWEKGRAAATANFNEIFGRQIDSALAKLRR